MFDYFDWWGYAILAALPAAAFLLGVNWGRRHPDTPAASVPPPPSDQLLLAVDAVLHQLEELAERQDFTERLLSNRQDPAKRADRLEVRIPTPV